MKRTVTQPQYFRALVKPESINLEDRSFDVVFVTERQVLMYNWDIGYFNEILVCEDGAGDLTRLNNGAPLCDTHDTSSVRNILGSVASARFENGQGMATVRMSKRPDVDSVWQDVQDGHIRGVSVGYQPIEYTSVENIAEQTIPSYRATKWEAYEISLAPVQADQDSMVRSEKKTSYEVNIIDTKKRTMEKEKENVQEETKPVEPVPAAPATEELAEARKQASIAERTRSKEILKAARAMSLPDEFADELIDSDKTLDQCRAAIIDKVAELNPVKTRSTQQVHVTADEADKRMTGMTRALEFRVDPRSVKAADAAEYRSFSLMDFARECLEKNGVNTRSMSRGDIAKSALGLKGARSGGMYSTGDFPGLLSNVFNKRLRAAYELQDPTFKPFVSETTATDFRDMMRNQIGDISFEPVLEQGEYKASTLAESFEKYRVSKFGRLVLIDWEAIVNDDLSAFNRIPRLIADAAAQKQADIVYNILTSNPNMADGKALFEAATHKNYLAAGTAISIDSLSAGRAAMRKQKSLGGKVLNLRPKYLVVAPDQEQLAYQYTSTNYTANTQGVINPFAGMLTPIVEGRLDPNKAYYLISDPSSIDTIETAFLDGEELHTEERIAFEKDGYEFKARMVFGAKAIDYRGMYKNAGA